LGGVNCSRFVNGQCLALTRSGQRWQDWVGHGAACPGQYDFGQKFSACGMDWTCIDHGGMVTGNHFDLLAASVPCDFSSPRGKMIYLLEAVPLPGEPKR
jgi:hypothetical protein